MITDLSRRPGSLPLPEEVNVLRLCTRLSLSLLVLAVIAITPVVQAIPHLDDPLPPKPDATLSPLPQSSDDSDALLARLGPEGFSEALPDGEGLLAWVAADLLGNGVDEVAVRTCLGPCEEPGNWSQGYLRVLTPKCLGYTLVAELPVDVTYNFLPGFDVAQILPEGRLGILEQSACGAHSYCLQMYAWDGNEFRIWEFGGSAGGVTVQPDGVVATGNRDYFTDPISNGFTMVYEWVDDDYRLRAVEFEGAPYEGAAGQVRAYFNTVNMCIYDADFHAAYNYLTDAAQKSLPYDRFVAPFENLRRLHVDDVMETEGTEAEAIVQGSISMTWEMNGEETTEVPDVSVRLRKEDGAWRIDQVDAHGR